MYSKILFAFKFFLSRFQQQSHYKIVRGYRHRKKYSYFNDTGFTDEFQNEVYELALDHAKKNNFRSVVDLGCGSGFKLMRYFEAFDTTGIDVDETIEYLRKQYPGRRWLAHGEAVPFDRCDLLICSDVIEHVLDPDLLVKKIISLRPKLILISTPDRKLLDMTDYFGPPRNPTHIREWTFHEFEAYLAEYFTIVDHRITHYAHATQLVVARLKQGDASRAETATAT